ncbi:MAG: AMP-binding protein [Candidatus Krumholzibacteria bacterium]|nr:AMP-binding protein [Candidatus Krumholzibacteria bacterium]
MHPTTFLSCLYGELRGYRRLRIRRRVGAGERLSREALAALSEALFQAHVQLSIARFPFYADAVARHRGALPKPGAPVQPEELPVWTRRDQRAFFEQQSRPADSFYVHQTSGSTGLPVRFHITRESWEWRNAVTDRAYTWAGAEEGRRSVYLWAAEQKRPPLSQRIKHGVHLVLQRRWYYDAFQAMTDAERAALCRLIDRVRPESIVGYTGMLVDVARYVRDHPGALRHRPRTMVSAAEGLQSGQRELLEAHLVREVYLGYGSREFMSVGMECARHAGYHINTDMVRVEVVDDDGRALPPGETGRIVVTDLRNAATPFIRYEIGDTGAMAPDEPCGCGKPFPRLLSVDGRLQDVVHTPEGGMVNGLYLTYTMRQFDWIEGYQVVQPSRARITVRLLTPEALTPERIAPVTALLRKKLGETIAIDYERADSLERRATGKVALVISSIRSE